MWLTLVFISCRPDQLLPEKYLTKGKCKAGQRFLTRSAFSAHELGGDEVGEACGIASEAAAAVGMIRKSFDDLLVPAVCFKNKHLYYLLCHKTKQKPTETNWCVCSREGRDVCYTQLRDKI